MALTDFKKDMEMCCRCSACKFIPFEIVKNAQHTCVCPSIARYNFHAYSGGGRIGTALAMMEKRLEYSDKLLEVVYNCQMCGACDISCKYAMDMEVLEPINEVRIKCVEDGHTLHVLDSIIGNLRKQDSMVPGCKTRKAEWAEDLDVINYTKQKTSVIYHVGCRTSFDKDLWKIARGTVTILKKAGIDIGIAAENEHCCGGRAYQMGYKEDFLRQAKLNSEMFKKSGAKTLVTSCAECFHAFKVLYDKFNLKGDLEVLHTSEYFERLIKSGKLNIKKGLDMKVTYHDPCNLGRLGEPYIHWNGKEIPGHIRLFEPPKEFRRGSKGVYEPPREVLRKIPGMKIVEMNRIKEYAWCCGAGGGVQETNPEFAKWTAKERIDEAEATGADAIVTACPGCEKVFDTVVKENGNKIKVYDIVDLLDGGG